MNGIVLTNKPAGISSHDVVQKIRKYSGIRRVGHAGTLDLEADGLLIILIGEACKTFELFMQLKKTYYATITLGASSDTWDKSGNIVVKEEKINFLEKDIIDAVKSFIGDYKHIVPEYSAKKYKGETFYHIKRKGQKPPERFQNTVIYDISLEKTELPDIAVSVECSSGTYIRSLAVDIGSRLGTSAYLKNLTRKSINGFNIIDSMPPTDGCWEKGFMNISTAMKNFSYIKVSDKTAVSIKNGVNFRNCDIIAAEKLLPNTTFVVFSQSEDLIALSELKDSDTYKIKRVFNIETD